MKKISIIVPVYKVEKYLPKCIESLIAQTLEDIEIILVDDGSPDNCGKICDRYAIKDKRIRVIHKKNGGVSSARNDGLKQATGEYIIFCDSDDWLDKNACKILYETAKKTDADVVFADIYISFEANRGIRNEICRFFNEAFVVNDKKGIDELVATILYYTYCPAPAKIHAAKGYYGGPWNKIIRRKMLQENGIQFNLKVRGIYDDVIYSCNAVVNSKRVAYVDKPVYYYRQNPTSMTSSFKKDTLQINKIIFTEWKLFLEKYQSTACVENACYANEIRRISESLPIYFFNNENTLSLKKRLKELKSIISTMPYQTAAEMVETKKLSPYHRSIAIMVKHRSVLGLWLMFEGKKKAKIVLNFLQNR